MFFVARSVHHGHSLSFARHSGLGLRSLLHFGNGGIPVDLLKWDRNAVSKTKKTLEAYETSYLQSGNGAIP